MNKEYKAITQFLAGAIFGATFVYLMLTETPSYSQVTTSLQEATAEIDNLRYQRDQCRLLYSGRN